MTNSRIFETEFGVLKPHHLRRMSDDLSSGVLVMTAKVENPKVFYARDEKAKYLDLAREYRIDDSQVQFAGLLMGGLPMYLLTGEVTGIPGYMYYYQDVQKGVDAILHLMEQARISINQLEIKR